MNAKINLNWWSRYGRIQWKPSQIMISEYPNWGLALFVCSMPHADSENMHPFGKRETAGMNTPKTYIKNFGSMHLESDIVDRQYKRPSTRVLENSGAKVVRNRPSSIHEMTDITPRVSHRLSYDAGRDPYKGIRKNKVLPHIVYL